MASTLSIADLWRETFHAGRVGMPLYLPLTAAFVLLPGVAIDLFGPAPPKSAADLTPNLVLVALVLPTLVGAIAQAAIVRLELDRRAGASRPVGEALGLALRVWPVLVVALLLAAIPTSVGLLLFVVPGLYLAGRMAMTLPLVVDRVGSPLAAVQASWAMTDGNGWRVIGFTLLWAVWFLALSAVAAIIGGGIATALGALGAGVVGAVAASTIGGLVAALFTVFNAVGLAAIYARLKMNK